MLPQKALRGHRRTMSSNFEEMGLYLSTAPDRLYADEISQRPLTHRPLASGDSTTHQSIFLEDTVANMVAASTRTSSEKTVLVEQLQAELQYLDPLFQFGKTKKPVVIATQHAKLATGNKLSSRQAMEDLFMIPETMTGPSKFFKKKCEESHQTKATDWSYRSDTKKLCSPHEVIGRMKAEKREAERQRQQLLAQKTKARLNILRTRR